MADLDPTSMSVSKLKKVITEGGLSYKGLVEKSEFIALAKEALVKLAAGGAVPSSGAASGGGGSAGAAPATQTITLSGYSCTVVDTGPAGQPFDLAVVILHGFGATSADFTPLAPMFAEAPAYAGKRVRWVLPQAPSGAMGVPAWWDINVQEWMGISMGGASEQVIARLIRQEHNGLPAARNNLVKLVDEVVTMTDGVTHSKLVLGGFSQGAMTAVDVALSQPAERRVAGILSMSGAPIVVEQWAKKGPTHKGLKVLMTHGRSDNVLPFMVAGWMKELLGTAGLSVDTAFHGQAHTLGPQDVVAKVRDFIASFL